MASGTTEPRASGYSESIEIERLSSKLLHYLTFIFESQEEGPTEHSLHRRLIDTIHWATQIYQSQLLRPFDLFCGSIDDLREILVTGNFWHREWVFLGSRFVKRRCRDWTRHRQKEQNPAQPNPTQARLGVESNSVIYLWGLVIWLQSKIQLESHPRLDSLFSTTSSSPSRPIPIGRYL